VRSCSVLIIAPPSFLFLAASSPDLIPLAIADLSLIRLHNPPINIAPTPINLTCFFHIVNATDIGSPVHGVVDARYGIKTNHASAPPSSTKIAMFNPTMNPTASSAGDKSIPI